MSCVCRQSTDSWGVLRLRYLGSQCKNNHTMKACGVKVQTHSLTSALHGEWSPLAGRFAQREISPFTHWNSRSHSRSRRLEEKFCPCRKPNHDSSVVQRVRQSQYRLGHRGSSLISHMEIPLFSDNITQSVNIPGENAVFQC
jgi:hypothetical protein